MMPPNPAPYPTPVSYERALENAGWSRIGEGVGGRVYHRDGDPKVIKVVENDACYMAFANYAQANPQPCLPDLTFAHTANGWAVIHIERLSPIPEAVYPEVDRWWTDWCLSVRTKGARPEPLEWSDLFDALRPLASAGSCGLDVKPDNVMVRPGTGEIVFMDPMSWLAPAK